MSRPDPADARTEIENLLYRYAEQIDAGDFAGLGDLLSRARIFSPNGDVIATGNAEIKAMYDRSTRVYEDGSPMTRHLTTNVMIDFDGDAGGDGRTAETRSRFTVMQALPDFPLQCIITGDYEDRFAHEASAGWYFTERTMKPRLLGDLSRHLNFDLSGA